MRKIIRFVHISLDGNIEGPAGEFDWPVMGPELSAYSFSLMERADTFLYGRPVWEMMAGYWPNVESISDDPHDLKFAPIWRSSPKIVFSRTLTEPGHGARVIDGSNLVENVTALKAEPGTDMLLMGGASLAAGLTAHGLIDEHHVVVHPVVLGGGRPLFAESAERLNLRLIESRTFDSRTVLLRYEPAAQ
ncbi:MULTISPECIES: dihydrofolate reductase family protein [unclassified Streptomyces]|uniref:dihydrofolate reductase family protein n=1 Tax=unclassified Streptomyces TaxID=2593676 RepID=UPI0035E032BD